MPNEPKKSPADCQSLEDIRAEIDGLDRAMIELIGQRAQYVQAAATFKTSEQAVRAPERVRAMLQQRRLWAQEQGLNPDVIGKLFADLVSHFIDEEKNRWLK
ncbi:MAG: isochorismate lyase [Nitrospira sp.]